MPLTTFFIDLDDTLYPFSCGIWPRIRDRIDLYLKERMHLAVAEIPQLRSRLVREFGTTLRGLQTVYHVDENDYLEFVHDVPVEELLSPNPTLRAALLGFHQKRIIFTNADDRHARRVISALGLDGCFDRIIDIRSLTPYCKPMPEAYAIAMEIAGEKNPSNCLLVDDLPANTVIARQLGFFSVLIALNSHVPATDSSHMVIERLEELPGALLTRMEIS